MARRRAQVDAIARALLARDSHAAEPQSEMSTSITSREQPRLVLIAGVNGAGKTTFATAPELRHY